MLLNSGLSSTHLNTQKDNTENRNKKLKKRHWFLGSLVIVIGSWITHTTTANNNTIDRRFLIFVQLSYYLTNSKMIRRVFNLKILASRDIKKITAKIPTVTTTNSRRIKNISLSSSRLAGIVPCNKKQLPCTLFFLKSIQKRSYKKRKTTD